MQVKKFEAKTMKDALELVKKHLGPEAIILSAKDNSRSFGLMGEKSVEVTAAITEETLRRKRLAEAKLNQELRERYVGATAKTQREFINQAHERAVARSQETPAPVKKRYIDIEDESMMDAAAGTGAGDGMAAAERVRGAAQRAWQAMTEGEVAPPPVAPAAKAQVLVAQSSVGAESSEIREIRAQISQLQGIIEGFQRVPQTILGMHPGAEEGICYDLSGMFQKLTRAGVSVENTVELLKKAQDTLPQEQLKRAPFVDAWVAKNILDQVQVGGSRTTDRYHVFVGPAGQGKTSALVKLASHMVICEKKRIAIVTADMQKVGAAEQLRIYSQILNVPFAVVSKQGDWQALEEHLKGVDHVLVDFPGVNLKSMAEVDMVQALMPPTTSGRAVHYVQSVLAKDESAFEAAARYQVIGFNDVIFTGLDQAAQHGLIYNFQKKFKVPLHSFGIGPQIPEDFEPATKERVVDLLFKLSKIKKDKTA